MFMLCVRSPKGRTTQVLLIVVMHVHYFARCLQIVWMRLGGYECGKRVVATADGPAWIADESGGNYNGMVECTL